MALRAASAWVSCVGEPVVSTAGALTIDLAGATPREPRER